MSSESPEIEAKLVAPTAAELMQLPEHLRALGFLTTEPERHVAIDHYLDTPDLDLFRAGWALRLRDTGTSKFLTLKALIPVAEDGVARREEIEEEVDWDGTADWSFDDQTLDGRVKPLVGDKTLWLLFQLRQDRLQFHVATEEDLWVEASMDLIRFEGTNGTLEGFEAELEYQKGPEEALEHMAQALQERTGWEIAEASKFERGLRAAGLV
ncbi:MAG: CYTH domain-containing protein [Planctomycetota bacterium]|jgi:inorganic triphosphatase YgiF